MYKHDVSINYFTNNNFLSQLSIDVFLFFFYELHPHKQIAVLFCKLCMHPIFGYTHTHIACAKNVMNSKS